MLGLTEHNRMNGETMTDRNIVDLAHRVLGADKVGRDLNNAAAWDAVDLVLENAPALARAVIDLTAKVKRMEALAGRLDVVANELEADGADDYADAARTDAHSIRAALNGGNQ